MAIDSSNPLYDAVQRGKDDPTSTLYDGDTTDDSDWSPDDDSGGGGGGGGGPLIPPVSSDDDVTKTTDAQKRQEAANYEPDYSEPSGSRPGRGKTPDQVKAESSGDSDSSGSDSGSILMPDVSPDALDSDDDSDSSGSGFDGSFTVPTMDSTSEQAEADTNPDVSQDSVRDDNRQSDVVNRAPDNTDKYDPPQDVLNAANAPRPELPDSLTGGGDGSNLGLIAAAVAALVAIFALLGGN